MSDLSTIDTDELVARWNSLIDQHKKLSDEIKPLLIKINNTEKELNIIKDELLRR